jgi:hypothetical protein
LELAIVLERARDMPLQWRIWRKKPFYGIAMRNKKVTDTRDIPAHPHEKTRGWSRQPGCIASESG